MGWGWGKWDKRTKPEKQLTEKLAQLKHTKALVALAFLRVFTIIAELGLAVGSLIVQARLPARRR